jgi:hypothetical protein
VLAVLGVIVLISPGFIVANWPWPTSPLMVRIFTSWFSAFGAGLIWFAFERDWQRVRPIATLMIASGVADLAMLFIHRGSVTSFGLNFWIFCLHLTLLGVVGALMHWLQRKARLTQLAAPAGI